MFALCIFLGAGLPACSLLKEKEDNDTELQEVLKKPLPPEKSEELLNEVGSNWLYGEGLGETALAAGSVVFFPPYAIYMLGNGILSLSGYEPIYVSDALPDEERDQWQDTYRSVVSGPGRLTSAVAGHEFRSQELAKERIKDVFKSSDNAKTQLIKDTNGQNRSSNKARN